MRVELRQCDNCKSVLNEWTPALCPDCGYPVDRAAGGEPEAEEEIDPFEEDVIEDPPLKKVSVERKVTLLAGAIWSELRCRSYSLDSERWTNVVKELLQELIDEFKERIAKADSLYQSRFDECVDLQKRLARYHKKYGCLLCGRPVSSKSVSDRCAVCCHEAQAEAARRAQAVIRQEREGAVHADAC